MNQELKAMLEKAAQRPIAPNKYGDRTSWNIVWHRIQRAKDGVPDCDCPKCHEYMAVFRDEVTQEAR